MNAVVQAGLLRTGYRIRRLSDHGKPIGEQPTKAVGSANQPLKSMENLGTSKLWVGEV